MNWTTVVTMAELDIVTDDRYPSWRARIGVDDHVGQPWGDALAPALLVERGHVEWAGEVYQSAHADRILEAWRRLEPDVFERYLRIAHRTSAVAQISGRDLTVITFDTAAYRDHVGITDAIADLTGEVAEWRAWLDGDVYEVVVERHTAEQCWTHQDSLCGLYGWPYARECAAELLAENAGPPIAAACTT
jgi:hypothetical protein